MDVGRYRLVERIGQGGMATVWRAEDQQLGRQVAIKVLLPFVAERGDAAERFEREARALAGIRHPNVLQLFDYLPAAKEEPARLVMELLAGPSLHRFVVDHGAPLPEVSALIAAEIAAGLVAVHARGIVHRDVKPENILLDEGRVVLTDFGVARVAMQERSALTQTGAIIGSPTYMSPEQARGDEVDARSDQFALGSLLYFLCTGAAPFTGPHPLVVMQRIDRGEYLPVGAKNPRVPAWLERVVKKCLQREPSARFADMSAVEEALRRGLADDGLPEPAVELRRYFAERQEYNAALDARLVARRLAAAESAWQRGDRAKALASVGAVLQVDAREPRALELLAALSRPQRRRLAVFALAVVGAAGAAFVPMRTWWASHSAAAPVAFDVAPVDLLPALEAPPSPDMSQLALAPPVVRPDRPAHGHARAAVAPAFAPEAVPTPTDSVATPVRSPPQLDAKAELSVRTSPWCDLSIDGHSIGLTPQRVSLEPGRHALRCVGASGASLERQVELAAGEKRAIEERLQSSAKLQPQLVRGDAIRVDDDNASRGTRSLAAGRHRVTLWKNGEEVEARWLDVPEQGCRLLDVPALRCEGP